MELELGEGVDVHERGDGASVGRLHHGVGVYVKGEGSIGWRFHGVMVLWVMLDIWLSFQNEHFVVHLNLGGSGLQFLNGTTHVLKYGVV